VSKRYHQNAKKQTTPQQPDVDLDIVIPVLNQFDYLKKCLDALPQACSMMTSHVYIADNASKKEDAEVFYKTLDLHHNTVAIFTENVGFPGACNYGANLGKSKYILFLNSDCFMMPGSITAMMVSLQTIPDVGIVGSKLLFPQSDFYDKARPAGKIQHAGLSFDITGTPQHIFVGWDADHPKVSVSCEVPAVTGACLLISRELFKSIGGFYEGYGIGSWEDIDICTSVRAMGRKVWYEATAVGEHVAGGTAIKEHTSFPLQRNKSIFQGRWQSKIYWSDPERY
jgi:GT2 family glycosyltransferase